METIFTVLLVIACITILPLIDTILDVVFSALTSTLFAIPVFFLWNLYFSEWFGFMEITLFQSWIICFTSRLITGLGLEGGVSAGD
jgi:hypothetical protein